MREKINGKLALTSRYSKFYKVSVASLRFPNLHFYIIIIITQLNERADLLVYSHFEKFEIVTLFADILEFADIFENLIL